VMAEVASAAFWARCQNSSCLVGFDVYLKGLVVIHVAFEDVNVASVQGIGFGFRGRYIADQTDDGIRWIARKLFEETELEGGYEYVSFHRNDVYETYSKAARHAGDDIRRHNEEKAAGLVLDFVRAL
jgi:hypothetical protein